MSVKTGYFGMTNVGGWHANPSYGLHLYNSATGWNTWTPTYSTIYCDNLGYYYTCPISDLPPTFHSVSTPWYSFYTTQ